jgi:FMN phosphatase YigB (HAD superfamily)
MKKIIVDIDNTLWDLSPELWVHLKPFNPKVPPPSQWQHWDFWEGHVSLRDLFQALRDEVHLMHDKSVLFHKSWAIIDDSPVTLEKAAQAGILHAGLLTPWNANTSHPLFKTLPEILEYLDSHISGTSMPLPTGGRI